MRRRLLSWAVAALIPIASLAHPPRACRGDVLDPNAFASLGTLSGGDLTIDSGDGTTAPVIEEGVGGPILATGVISNGVAVFDFDSVNLSSPNFAQGTLPIAILSRGDMTIGGLQESSQTGYPGGALSIGSGPTGGGGMGGPPTGPPPINMPGSDGGAGASGLVHSLLGGNAGEIEYSPPLGFGLFPGKTSGGGGAAFEFVALGALTVGDVGATGGDGLGAAGRAFGGQGGGGGGGILLSGNAVSIVGTLDVSGGAGGGASDFGGAGGGGNGGEIDVFYGPGGFVNTGSLLADGGAGGVVQTISGGGGPGGADGIAGAIHISSVPEPSALALLALGAAVTCGKARRKSMMARP